MGIKNLWQLLSPVGRSVSIETLAGKVRHGDESTDARMLQYHRTQWYTAVCTTAEVQTKKDAVHLAACVQQ